MTLVQFETDLSKIYCYEWINENHSFCLSKELMNNKPLKQNQGKIDNSDYTHCTPTSLKHKTYFLDKETFPFSTSITDSSFWKNYLKGAGSEIKLRDHGNRFYGVF